MIELLDVLDEAGHPTGQTKTKAEILRDGNWRKVIHVWIVDDKEQLLIQQRAHGRGIFDDLWDVSVGGGVSAGEPSLEAARRELDEELGIDLPANRFQLLDTWKIPPKRVDDQRFMKDFSDTFLVRIPAIDLDSLKLAPREVQAAATIELAEFDERIQDAAFAAKWVPHGRVYYREVISKIRKRR
jgi:isopentenyldiphosphate isomerase